MVGPFYEFVDESLLQKFNITRPQPQECCFHRLRDYDLGSGAENKLFGLGYAKLCLSDPDPALSFLVPDLYSILQSEPYWIRISLLF